MALIGTTDTLDGQGVGGESELDTAGPGSHGSPAPGQWVALTWR